MSPKPGLRHLKRGDGAVELLPQPVPNGDRQREVDQLAGPELACDIDIGYQWGTGLESAVHL